MFKHLLIALDGSRMAESVLPAAKFIVRLSGASVRLVHVIEKNAPGEVHRETHLRDPKAADEYLRGVATRWFPDVSGMEIHVHEAAVSDVPHSIVQHASEFESDLIFLCTHGSGSGRRLMWGSIAQQVVGLGSAPVFIMHAGKPGEGSSFACRTILAPVDGQKEHEAGLTIAAHLAKAAGATLHLLMVVRTSGTVAGKWAAVGLLLPGATARVLEDEADGAAEYLRCAERDLRERGIRVVSGVKRGDPAATVRRASRETRADLIVLGTHGKSGVDAFWSESVASRICGMCKAPLLLVPVRTTGAGPRQPD
jgi:nucleotide-binding universal stress UspA family protein